MKNLILFSIIVFISTISAAQEIPEVHIRIKQVTSGKNDTLWLVLDAGTNLNIRSEMQGTAVQVFRSKSRDYQVLSQVNVTKVSATEATGFVVNKDKEYVIPDDQVVFTKLNLKEQTDDGKKLITAIAAFNIQFIDLYSTPFYEQKDILLARDKKSFDSLLSILRQDIIETAEYLTTEIKEKPAAWTEPLTAAKFKGKSLLKAMSSTSLLDIETFLQFVASYPGKYIGRKWKFNETYATWIINDMPWPDKNLFLTKHFLKIPSKDIKSWAWENAYYQDTLIHYVTNTIDNYITTKKFDSANFYITKGTLLGEVLDNKILLATLQTSRGNIAQFSGGKEGETTAINHYSKALALDSNNWAALWYRGNLFAEREQYTDAVKDMKVLNKLFPNYASAFGNQGWWHLKQFKVKEAGPLCIKAFELDTTSSSWAVNLAHYYLLSGQNQKARTLYQKTLSNLTSELEFVSGPLTDFEFFAERGILTDVFEREKTWMLDRFNKTYKHYIQADSLFTLAKDLRTKGEYLAGAELFKKSREAENRAEIKRSLFIHNITTWIGYMYMNAKEYEKSEAYYMEALAVAKTDFPKQMSNDLELLSDLYALMGNKALSESYKSQSIGWKIKSAEEVGSNDLYVLSIGIDEYPDHQYQWAAVDAENIATSLKKQGKRFNNIYTYTLKNKHAVSDSIDKNIQNIIALAKDEDTFVFYFTGKAENREKESFLLPYGLKNTTDSNLLKKAISAQLLRSWSNSINARHQLFLLDAPALNFSSAFSTQNASLSKNFFQKDILILAATFPRIETPEKKSSIVAASLLNLLSDSSFNSEKVITGKKIETFFAEEISLNNYYLSFESFSQGRDFILAEKNPVIALRSVAATTDPGAGQRGIKIENTSEGSGFNLNKKFGLFIATDNYSDPKWARLNNPVDDAKDLKTLLEEEYGFEIEIVKDPTKAQIFNKIDEYSKKRFEPNDQLVILFAGHGYYDARRNEGYLVPTDATHTNVEFDRYYYPMSSIMRDLKIIPAKHMLVLVDACHGGAICDNALMRSDGDLYSELPMEQLLKNHLEYPNRLILTSGRKDQTVPDGIKGKNSPFIAAILNALKSKEAKDKGAISYYQLMKHISDVQKTQATSAIFSPNDNWNFMFFHAGKKNKSPIADPSGMGGTK